MVQLLSTKELEKWFDDHQKVLHDPITRISVISNMTRFEDGTKNEFAGVDAIKVVRNKLPKQK